MKFRGLLTKKQILEEAGYSYSFDREIYLNRKVKKVLSLEFVEEHSEQSLSAIISEPSPSSGEWHFYFNSPPSEGVKSNLRAILG